ncbi:MAG TPA: GNAT family N-acetyltransferase [Acidimicrobiales bacterium]|jgi:hypothetical protein
MSPTRGEGDEPVGPPSNGGTITYVVTQVDVSDTLALRQAVLRPYLTIDEVGLPDDDDPSTAAFAAVDAAGELLSVARVTLEAAPFPTGDMDSDGSSEWRLRGMATQTEARHRGLGSAVVRAIIAYVGAQGGGLLWCNARVPAVELYRRAGFTSYGEEWLDPDIGPHIVMWRLVAAA